MAKEHMETCSMSLVLREMQIEATKSCHLICIRTTVLTFLRVEITRVGKDAEKRESRMSAAGGKVRLRSHLGRQYIGSSNG